MHEPDRSLGQIAADVAREWGITIGEPFELSNYSLVAPAGEDMVLEIGDQDDDESLQEADALKLWDGNAGVRLVRADPVRRALLLERASPGTDLAALDPEVATAIAVDVATRLWRPASHPFRWIGDQVPGWLARATPETSGARHLLDRARDVFARLDVGAAVLVHGDLHHHNILDAGGRYVAIDPKPMLGEPEFDVPPFLWNPLGSQMTLAETERRLAAFADAGLDDMRMRQWALIRGAYLCVGDWVGPGAVDILEAIQPD